MSERPYRLGVLGGTAEAREMLAFELAAAAPGPHRVELGARSTWAEVSDRAPDALVLLDCPQGTAEAVTAAVAAGLAVLCPAADGATSAAIAHALVDSSGPGVALCPSSIRHTAGGGRIVAAARSARLGTLHSAYLSLRADPSDPQWTLETLLWESMDLVAALTDSPVARIHAVRGADVLTAILRFADDLVVTVDLSRTPRGPAASGPVVEAEVELVGDLGLLRAEPYVTAVRTTASPATLGFGVNPLRAMLAELLSSISDTDERAVRSRWLGRVSGLAEAVASASPDTFGTWRAGRPAA